VAAQPWGASEFIAHLSRRDCVGWVAGLQHSDAIVGSVLYEFCKDHFKICKLSVNPDFIELGIACHLLEHVQRKLISSETRWRIDAVVDEQELTTLQHFKAAGFTAIDVYQDYFKSEHGTCDGFLFTFDRDDAKKKFSVSLEQLNWWRGLVGSGKE
jgi:ribosomal protein S18 acetylase RimI-like enzyme